MQSRIIIKFIKGVALRTYIILMFRTTFKPENSKRLFKEMVPFIWSPVAITYKRESESEEGGQLTKKSNLNNT